MGIAKKIFEEEPREINKKSIIEKMDVNIPIFILGINDGVFPSVNKNVSVRPDLRSRSV